MASLADPPASPGTGLAGALPPAAGLDAYAADLVILALMVSNDFLSEAGRGF